MPKKTPPIDATSARELESAAAFRAELRRFLNATQSVAALEALTTERYDLLLMIKAAAVAGEPSTVTSLGERLHLRQQAVTELVKRAVQAGLVARERSSGDGRVSFLRLTPDGEDRLMRVFQTLREDRAALGEAFDRLGTQFRAATS